MSEDAHHVTISDLYHKVEDESRAQREELAALRADIQVIIDRDRRDSTRIEELESSTRWLSRTVYALGVPIVLLLSGYEAVTKLIL